MILDEILATKRREVELAKARCDVSELKQSPLYAGARKGFAAALREERGRVIIAEIKKASPSKGLIREDFDPVLHAAQYEKADARCISVLTDEEYFQGSLDILAAVRGATKLPLLRKDFMVDPYQMVEARAFGADAILLIVAALNSDQLVELSAAARSEELDILVEVHDAEELKTAINAGAELIGVNNRNLKTFETSINTTRVLAPAVPDNVVLISESGFRHPHELSQLESIGVNAFLIGESLMRYDDPGEGLSFFMGNMAP